ncbi:MAG: acyl carrier protein [Myxococcota bacterium]|jgi:acyl carrier protein
MTDEQILTLVREALDEVAPGKSKNLEGVTLDVSITELSLDSVSTMEMLGVIEERLDATFPDEDLMNLNKLSDVAKLIRSAA